MSRTAPWHLGNVPGWVVAQNLTGESLERILQKAKNSLLIVSQIEDFEKDLALKYIRKLASKGATIVFTPWAVKAFDIAYDEMIGLVEVTDRIVKGYQIGKKSNDFDYVFFFGGNYYHQSQMLSSLKNFATQLTTVSLTRYKQPNASHSFPNLKEARWTTIMESALEAI